LSLDNRGKNLISGIAPFNNPIETFVMANRTHKLSETMSRRDLDFDDNTFNMHEQSTQT
jgi:hypothetical protein